MARCQRSRGGVWYPEDRLRAALSGALVIIPLSMVLSGIVTEYIDGPIGLTLNLVCFFLNGFGVRVFRLLDSPLNTAQITTHDVM